jgi:formate hydrogenlyase subunit 6/NADH:ubiquinone oxidoreductase subunit I/flavodoxin
MTSICKSAGRRNFLIASVAAAGALAFDGIAKVLNLFSGAATSAAGNAKKPLKAVVVYYSATGSTTKAALAIHRCMSKLIDCDILPLKKADPKKMAKYDLIGLGGPIWYSRETANLKLFVHNMPQMPGKLSFLFCTHGTGPDGFMWSLSQTVLKRSLTIIGWADWYGSVFQVLHQPKPYITDGHPDAIDLAEAEAFGQRMAENAQKIAAGDTSLIPEIPTGEDADSLWLYRGGNRGFMSRNAKSMTAVSGGLAGGTPSAGGGPSTGLSGGPSGGAGKGHGGGHSTSGPPMPPMPSGPMGVMKPTVDMTKCVYPRCNACEECCPVNAIDFSLNAPGRATNGATDLIIKNACVGCSLCERVCTYDAAVLGNNGGRSKTSHAIDMKLCTYPRCTLCSNLCPMSAIDLTKKPPVFHRNCEGCDLCWCVCPTGAVSIPNIKETQIAMRHLKGGGNIDEVMARAVAAGKFRWDVKPEDVGWDTPIFMNQNTPRIIVHDDGNAIYCYKPCKM